MRKEVGAGGRFDILLGSGRMKRIIVKSTLPRTKLKEGMEVIHPHPNLENFSILQSKMVVKCTSAEQFAGQRTISKILLLKRKKFTYKKVSQGKL